jgi:hypothetical protein
LHKTKEIIEIIASVEIFGNFVIIECMEIIEIIIV